MLGIPRHPDVWNIIFNIIKKAAHLNLSSALFQASI